jgi:hypothetical protein
MMNTKEKYEIALRCIRYGLISGLLLVCIMLDSLSAKADNDLDIVFLQEAEDGNTYLYGFDVDSTSAEAQMLFDEPIDTYENYENWVVFVSGATNRRIIRLNVESGEQTILYQCASESHCHDVHFGINEDSILFTQKDVFEPLLEYYSLYRLDLGAEAEIVQRDIDRMLWISATQPLLIYDPLDGEAAQLSLYDYGTDSIQNVEVGCLFCGGISRAFTADGRYYLEATDERFELKDMMGETVQTYAIPITNYDFLVLGDWNPDNRRILYSSYPLDSHGMETVGTHIFLFDVMDESNQALWIQNEFRILEMKWNLDGTMFSLITTSPDAEWYISEGQIWLYDMLRQEPLPLPVSGSMVRWLG